MLTHRMAEFRRASQDQINVFEVDEVYLFKHYFESDEVFGRLKRFYNNQQYRYEVPLSAFEELRSFLTNHDYEPTVVNVIEPFIVVVKNTPRTQTTSSKIA